MPENPATPTQIDSDALSPMQNFCREILQMGDLETKLRPPTAVLAQARAHGGGEDRSNPTDSDPTDRRPAAGASPLGRPVEIDRPQRAPGLRMQAGSDRLPRPGQLKDAEHRIVCLRRFAHHELQAVELFAWALLRWPAMPNELVRGLLSALADEQRHCRLYLDRLAAHGGSFETDDHSDYFWQQAPTIAAAPHGPCAFLSAMGLTLEQANLDFTLTYRDAFAEAGDTESARVCQTVHDDEIAHVALAARWVIRLAPGDRHDQPGGDLDAYLETVPFPMHPARAKGRRFEVGPRRRAGLSAELIEHVRTARSNTERGLAAVAKPRSGESSQPS